MVGEIKIRLAEGAMPPSYATEGSAGADVHALLDAPIELAPGERRLVQTGVYMEIPEGFEVQVRPRSGLALRHGLTVLNSPGTIDWDYRGELRILLVNLGGEKVRIEAGDRIAQIVVAPVVRGSFDEVDRLSESVRGERGFGHTGL